MMCPCGCAAPAALAAAFALAPPAPAGVRVRLDVPLLLVQEPIQAGTGGDAWALRLTPPDGCRVVRLDPGADPVVLTPEFASAADPCVSPEGRRVLFAGKRLASDRWRIWEMGADGSAKRPLTEGDRDALEPVYLTRNAITAPEFLDRVRWFAFRACDAAHSDEKGRGPLWSLHVQTLETVPGRGVVTWRTSFNLSSDLSPTLLEDGRVLFTSFQWALDRFPPRGISALLAMNWAGTGLNAIYGNHEGPAVKAMACELPDRTIVFVESDGSSSDGSGRLARISLRRPLKTYEPLSRDRGRYRNPHALPDGRLVVAQRDGAGSFALRIFDMERRQAGPLVYDDPAWNDVDPVPLAPRPEPHGRIPIVVETRNTGHLQCLNVYDSDRPALAGLEPGTIERARFVEGLPAEPARDGRPAIPARVRIIGEAPVAPDGSFYVEIPADTPFFIQLLDRDGMAVETMRAWMWVRRGSRRGCIGCHEDKELAPENRATDALREAKWHRLPVPPALRRFVDFRHDVVPILRRRCSPCHDAGGGGAPAWIGGTDAGARKAYEQLLAPREGGSWVVRWKARESALAQVLLHRGADGGARISAGSIPDEERRRIVEWIDLGAAWDARLAEPEP